MHQSTFRTLFRAVILLALSSIAAFAQKTINIPADYPTIQGGINAASTGDTVLVAPGIYNENLDFIGKAITVTSSGGAAQTIVDGGGKDATVHFWHGELRSSIISNLTIRNGGTLPSSSSYEGGGVVVDGAAPSILNNIITGNLNHAIQVEFGAALIQGNELSGTLGTGSAFFEGSGVILAGNSTIPGFSHSSLIGNTIQNNLNAHSYDAGGIGLWAVEGTVIQQNIIRNNATSGDGGAIASFNTDAMSIVGNLINGNRAASAGAISILAPGESAGPFIGVIANNTIANNTITTVGPDAATQVFLQGNLGQYVMVNNIVSGASVDVPSVVCDLTYNYLSYTPLVFDHNDIYNAAGAAYGGACPDQSGTYGNISADPGFIAAFSGDFHLRPRSPAVDAGNNSAPLLPGKDLDGNARIQDATGLGYPVVDMGAYELGTSTPAPITVLTLSPSTFYPGSSGVTTRFTLTAQLTSAAGVPTGPITFLEDLNQVGVLSADASGSATLTPAVPTPGLHAFLATYAGQGAFAPAVSVKFYVLFPKITPLLTLTSSLNPSIVGQAVTFTIKIAAVDTNQLGPVVLTDGGTTLATLTPDASGAATYTTSALTLGNHTIAAAYSGDSAHNPASASLTQQVMSGYATSTTLTSSLNPSVFSQAVTFTAGVTSTNGTPTGSIQFNDGVTVLATQPLSATGTASFTTSALAIGVHTITATYIPTLTFAGSSVSITQTVNAVTNTVNVSSSLNPSTYGQSITITANVSSNIGTALRGSVAFYDNGFLALQPIDVAGNATYTTSSFAVGGHLVTAVFTPLGSTITYTGSYTQQVNGLASSTLLTASPTSGIGRVTPVTLTATVAPAVPANVTLTGPVIFYLNGAQLAVASLVNGIATYTGTLPAGVNQLYVNYAGDPNRIYDSSNSNTITVTMSATPTTLNLASSANPSPALFPLTFTAQLLAGAGPAALAGQPVVFTIDGKIAATLTTTNQGIATLTTSALSPGTHTITASFAGDLTSGPSASPTLTEQIVPDATFTTVLPPLGTITQLDRVSPLAVVRSNYLTATPTGSVTIFEGTTALATGPLVPAGPISNASILLNPLSPGTHVLVAVYTPDTTSFLPSQSVPFTLIVVPASFTLTLSDPTLTLQTGHHHADTVSLTSIGGLGGTFTLSCGAPLPTYTTCTWAQNSVTLPIGGSVSTNFTVDTDQLIGFLSQNGLAKPAVPTRRQEWLATTLATLLPFALFGLRRRNKLRPLLSLLLLATLSATLTACGADKYPGSTAPGTYIIPVTATGPAIPGGVTPVKTVNLTLIVTP